MNADQRKLDDMLRAILPKPGLFTEAEFWATMFGLIAGVATGAGLYYALRWLIEVGGGVKQSEIDAELVKYMDKAFEFLRDFTRIAERQKSDSNLIRDLEKSSLAVIKAKEMIAGEFGIGREER